jgi:hypothetical protein
MRRIQRSTDAKTPATAAVAGRRLPRGVASHPWLALDPPAGSAVAPLLEMGGGQWRLEMPVARNTRPRSRRSRSPASILPASVDAARQCSLNAAPLGIRAASSPAYALIRSCTTMTRRCEAESLARSAASRARPRRCRPRTGP